MAVGAKSTCIGYCSLSTNIFVLTHCSQRHSTVTMEGIPQKLGYLTHSTFFSVTILFSSWLLPFHHRNELPGQSPTPQNSVLLFTAVKQYHNSERSSLLSFHFFELLFLSLSWHHLFCFGLFWFGFDFGEVIHFFYLRKCKENERRGERKKGFMFKKRTEASPEWK